MELISSDSSRNRPIKWNLAKKSAGVGVCAILALCLLTLTSGCGNNEPGGTAAGAKAGGTQKGGTTTGGSSAGGAVSGGAVSGGAVSGGATSGGAITGGSTGGNASGGAPKDSGVTGGNTTDDAATAGAKEGGATSGGTITGGTTTTGGTSSGGTGGTTVPATPAAGDLYVSPTGNDSNAGTKESPLKSLAIAISKMSVGHTVWLMEGSHKVESKITITSPSGESGKPISIKGVAGSRPVVDFSPLKVPVPSSAHRGIEIKANYWVIQNLELKDAGDNCLYISGANNIAQDLTVHDCGDTGILLTDKASYNKVINCDSFLNFDYYNVVAYKIGENADGFAAKVNLGPGNEFHGCRSYNNSDDGWDFYDAGPDAVTMKNCWAFEITHPKNPKGGDGNGIKLGGEREYGKNGPHNLENCYAFDNRAWGFDLNNNKSGGVTCKNCGAWNNKKGAFEAGIIRTGDVTLSVTAEKAKAAKRDASGNLPDIKSL